MTLDSLRSTPFCLENLIYEKGHFNSLTAFSVQMWLNKVKLDRLR